MILVDTGVWIDHFRLKNLVLSRLLLETRVRTHAFVIGELALGGLANRADTLETLARLPRVTVATDEEVMLLVETERLAGEGIGLVDAHLLAAARLSATRLWTRDRRLASVAKRLGMAYTAA